MPKTTRFDIDKKAHTVNKMPFDSRSSLGLVIPYTKFLPLHRRGYNNAYKNSTRQYCCVRRNWVPHPAFKLLQIYRTLDWRRSSVNSAWWSERHTSGPAGGRLCVKKVIYCCPRCARFRLNPAISLMELLSADRVSYTGPFEASRVDFAGPIYVSVVELWDCIQSPIFSFKNPSCTLGHRLWDFHGYFPNL